MKVEGELIKREGGVHIQTRFRLLAPELLFFRDGKDQLYHEVFDWPGFQRLKGVKALGFLTKIIHGDNGLERIPDAEGGFPHDRLYHSVLVARTTEAILRENKFSQEDINLGILAGLLHDIATPAGGDAIKGLDPKRLDEEDHWKEVLGKKGLKIIQEAGVSMEDLDRTIHNQGIVGQVLDIADRIAYTYADTYYIHGVDLASAGPLPYRYPYQEIQVDKKSQTIVFTDPFYLSEILSKRAVNSFHVYTYPVNRAADMLIRRLVEPFYSHDGTKPLTPQRLRQMTDEELLAFLHTEYGLSTPDFFQIEFINFSPEHHITSPDKVEELARRISSAHEGTVIIGAEWLPKVDPCTSYLVKHPSTGKVVSFKEFDPLQAGTIELLTKRRGPFFLYTYDAEEPTPFNQLVKKALNK